MSGKIRNLMAVAALGLIGCLAAPAGGLAQYGQAGVPAGPLVVHFAKNRADLGAAEISRMRDGLQVYDLAACGKIFVVGYTDSRGARPLNDQLSRRRAQAVRMAMIRVFGLKPESVIALGRGPQNPVAGNKARKGRLKNRRAEIYLTRAVLRPDANLDSINKLVVEARDLVRGHLLALAFKKLEQARALGGDQYADWHTVYGLAGFYGGAPETLVAAHLKTALRLDAYQGEARAYLSRVTARENVAAGKVTPSMGLTPKDPIPVAAVAQEFEYLHLFNVQPLAQHSMRGYSLHVWECRDSLGRPVAYHFDRSQVFAWAFATDSDLSVRTGSPSPELRNWRALAPGPIPRQTAEPASRKIR